MPDTANNQLPPRHHLPPSLAQKFVQDYEDVIQHYSNEEKIELTEHLLRALELMKSYAADKDSAHYKEFVRENDELLKKYRSRFKPFADKSFYKYFHFDLILSLKGIVTSEQYNAMAPGTQGLSQKEVKQFVQMCTNVLSYQRQLFYLQDDSGEQIAPEATNDSSLMVDEPGKEITKARQLLAIYYFLKASSGIEARDSISVSGVAKFIHLLTGTKFTALQNSDIYKKYLQMPNYKKGSQLIADLQYIRPFFEELGMENAVTMINEEIARATKELPFGERTKQKP